MLLDCCEPPEFSLGGDDARAKIEEVFGVAAVSNRKSQIVNHKYRDVPGLCCAATVREIEAQSWSLNRSRYIRRQPGGETVSDADSKQQLEAP